MKTLQTYVERENKFAALFNRSPLDLNNAADRQRLAQKIDAALSPENLTCDGELPPAEVQRRYKELTMVAKQLIKLDPTVAKFMYEFS